jgi:hypothetical protein
LPETPDMEKVEHLLVQMREAFYNC